MIETSSPIILEGKLGNLILLGEFSILYFYLKTGLSNPGIISTTDPDAVDPKKYCIPCRVKLSNTIYHW
jgi:hypothetical protein